MARVLGRIFRVFRRFAEANLRIALLRPGTRLSAAGVGVQITRAALCGNRLVVDGAGPVAPIALRSGGFDYPPEQDDTEEPARFQFDIPCQTGAASLIFPHVAGAAEIALPEVTRAQLVLAHIWLAARFGWLLLRWTPLIWRWRKRGDLVAGQGVKEALGLVAQARALDLPADLFLPDTDGAMPMPSGGLVIVLPIFNAFDLLREALRRVERHTDLDWHLIAIEDCSTDPRLRPFLHDWAGDPRRAGRVTLLENAQNLGFIGSVNRGLAEARARCPDRPVVLLNSDALVPPGWASRLLAPLADPRVASVTPMSNDAQILSVPEAGARTDLTDGAAEHIDAIARGLSPRHARAEVPTGIGFCMALAPRFLRHLPVFDPVFGRGYGEETDWCQKARRLGGRHIGIATLFVEHRGSASFGPEKQALLAQNHARITRRYPRYETEVDQFLRRDPLSAARFALALADAGRRQDAPVTLWLAHAQGGGAEHYLQDQIAGELRQGRAAVVLRVGTARRWRLELHRASGVHQAQSDDADLIVRLVQGLGARRIIYSCGVGDPDPLELPGMLARLGHDQPIEVLFHDFFPISPSYTLLDAEGCYRGVPRPETLQAQDPAHQAMRAGRSVPLAEWQAAWGGLISRADRLTVFSRDTRDIVLQLWPEAAGRTVICPHRLRVIPGRTVPPAARCGGPPVIGVLGNIGPHKGAEVLARLSAELARRDAARLVLIGTLDPTYHLMAPARIHGAYAPADLHALAARYGIAAWLIPSIWPETFSFTTHEALASGLPTACFDLGAQAEAVRSAGAQGVILPLPAPGESPDIGALLRHLAFQEAAA